MLQFLVPIIILKEKFSTTFVQSFVCVLLKIDNSFTILLQETAGTYSEIRISRTSHQGFFKGTELNPFLPGAAVHIETSHLFLLCKTNNWLLYKIQHLAEMGLLMLYNLQSMGTKCLFIRKISVLGFFFLSVFPNIGTRKTLFMQCLLNLISIFNLF